MQLRHPTSGGVEARLVPVGGTDSRLLEQLLICLHARTALKGSDEQLERIGVVAALAQQKGHEVTKLVGPSAVLKEPESVVDRLVGASRCGQHLDDLHVVAGTPARLQQRDQVVALAEFVEDCFEHAFQRPPIAAGP